MLSIRPRDVTRRRASAVSEAAPLRQLQRGERSSVALSYLRGDFLRTRTNPRQEVEAVLMTLVYIKITLLQEASCSLGKACLALPLLRHLAGRSINQAKIPP